MTTATTKHLPVTVATAEVANRLKALEIALTAGWNMPEAIREAELILEWAKGISPYLAEEAS